MYILLTTLLQSLSILLWTSSNRLSYITGRMAFERHWW